MKVYVETTRDPDVEKLRSLGFQITKSVANVAFKPSQDYVEAHPDVVVYKSVNDLVQDFVR